VRSNISAPPPTLPLGMVMTPSVQVPWRGSPYYARGREIAMMQMNYISHMA
jgi:hypothetical protein